jgi:putative membrane protein
MRYIAWTIKLILFAVLVLFAYKNMGPVDVMLFGDARFSDVPLVVVMLVAFVAGTLLGVFLMLPSTWQRRREAWRLKRELKRSQKTQAAQAAQAAPAEASSLTADPALKAR